MDKTAKQLLAFGPFRVDPEQRLLLRDQQVVSLSPKAFDLLLALIGRSGQVVMKDDLMQLLWPDTFVEESNLGQHVFQLRKALGERAQDHTYIVTVPGRGYRFAQKVQVLQEEEVVVVQSHTRSRLIMEEGLPGNGQNAEQAHLPPRELVLLPPAPTATHWNRARIAALVLISATVSSLAAWALLRSTPMPRIVRSIRITHIGRADPGGLALTDGPRIFFTQRSGGTETLAQVAEHGGEPSLISTSVDHVGIYDIDRRQSRLLIASETQNSDGHDPLWVVPTTGGSARRIGDMMTSDAAWSPDGQNIAYSVDNDLFMIGDDGLRPHKLLSAQGVVEYLRWSPDGQHLSFTVRDPSGSLSLWETPPDGRDPHQISFGWKAPASKWGEGEFCGDWSPDGRYFIFRSNRDGVKNLWITRREKHWFRRTQSPPSLLYSSPDRMGPMRFAADGRKILFVGNQERRELVRYDSTRKQFVPYLGGIPARHLSFSRDGQWVAYRNELDGTLWRSRADGTQALQLTFPPLDTYHPTWSPDGKSIAFQGDSRLYVVPINGGKLEALLPEGPLHYVQPSWSPDGKSLAFVRWTTQWEDRTVGLLDVATRQVQMLPSTERFEDPQWSPDGKHLAAGNKKDHQLMLFDLASRQWSELADGTPYGWGIRWSADSNYVYYQHVSGDEQPIFRVRVSDRKVEQITSARQILRADTLSISMTGLTPDNSPLASLMRTNSDVYALELDLP